MPDRFNIALRPSSPALARQTIALAEAGFSSQAEGYLLGRDAWPHITLCQFRGPEPDAWIDKIWSELGLATLDLQFAGYYLRESGKDENCQWVGLELKGDPALLDLQRRAHDLVKSLKLEVITGTGEDYFPHLTFARLGPGANKVALTRLPAELLHHRNPFYLTIGKAGPLGTYTSQILPPPQE